MTPQITFDKSAAGFVASCFGKTFNEDGYIITPYKGSGKNGRKVKCLINSKFFGPGIYEIIWDGTDLKDNQLPNGLYLLILIATPQSQNMPSYLETKKLLLIR